MPTFAPGAVAIRLINPDPGCGPGNTKSAERSSLDALTNRSGIVLKSPRKVAFKEIPTRHHRGGQICVRQYRGSSQRELHVRREAVCEHGSGGKLRPKGTIPIQQPEIKAPFALRVGGCSVAEHRAVAAGPNGGSDTQSQNNTQKSTHKFRPFPVDANMRNARTGGTGIRFSGR